MLQYNKLIAELKKSKIITDNYEFQKDNLIIRFSDTLTVTVFQDDTTAEFYINSHYFGTLDQQNSTLIFQALLNNDKVFIEYRKPIGIWNKEYFKIRTKEWFQSKKEKLSKRRGIKVYDCNEVFIDRY